MKSHLQLRALGRSRRLLAGLILTLAACAPAPETTGHAPLRRVVSTIVPLDALVRPLLPDRVECRAVIGVGEAVHGHRASPAEVAIVREADIVFAVGLGIDAGILDPLVRNPDPRQGLVIFAEVVGTDPHQSAGDHDHETHDHGAHGIDAHLWLDPVLAALFVETAAETLAGRALAADDAALADEIRERSAAWLVRIRAVDDAYRERLAPFRGRTVLTAHPAFGRLLTRYGLGEVSFSPLSPHSAPSPAQLAEAVRFAHEHGAAAIFTEPLAPRGAAEAVAERTGLPLGTLDPLGNGDWEAMMNANLDAFVAALTQAAPAEAEASP